MEKSVIFVPHQDDEINLVGNILMDLVKKYDTYIVYSSLEVNLELAKIRKSEAINACRIYGIAEDKIIFLGYPDTPNRNGHHFFTDGNKKIVQDIQNILLDLRPKLIIGTDFDFHSDHRMLALALDDAIKNVMVKNKEYTPKYLKGFCYETAYYGLDDYSASSLKETKVKSNLLSNVSYRWDDRISIKNNEQNGFIFSKVQFKALKCHKSQYAAIHARSIINSDNVFWEKRLDNLLIRDAIVTSSSGNVKKINDLKVIDTDDILTENPYKIDYSKSLWIPDEADNHPIINVDFTENKAVNQIVFHGNPNNSFLEKCNIEIHCNDQIYYLNFLNPYGQATVVNIEKVNCSKIEICFFNKVFISEIEVFQTIDSIQQLQTINFKDKKNSFIDQLDNFFFSIYVFLEKIRRKMNLLRRNIR